MGAGQSDLYKGTYVDMVMVFMGVVTKEYF